jgi:hypothetical protein
LGNGHQGSPHSRECIEPGRQRLEEAVVDAIRRDMVARNRSKLNVRKIQDLREAHRFATI